MSCRHCQPAHRRLNSYAPTTQLYVAAKRKNFASFADEVVNLPDSETSAQQLFEIEAFRAVEVDDRTQWIDQTLKEPLLEVVLHTSGVPQAGRIVEAFEDYAESLNLEADFDRRFEVGSLCFLPVRADTADIERLGQFAFLRTIRQMPELRLLNPIIRSSAKSKPFKVKLPEDPPLDPQVRAAVFDGGLTEEANLGPFVHGHKPDGIGAAFEEFLDRLERPSSSCFRSTESSKPIVSDLVYGLRVGAGFSSPRRCSGALCEDDSRWLTGGSKFLFPVRAISKKSRGKLLDGLERLIDAGELDRPRDQATEVACERRLLRGLSPKFWVVYSKAPYAGLGKLLD